MTVTSDTAATTEYTDIPDATAEDVREGDRVTWTSASVPGEVTATVYLNSLGQRKVAGWGIHAVDILRVERPVPALPTRPWALVVPKRWDDGAAYLLNGESWVDEFGLGEPTEHVHRLLADGSHYVAFEGVES